MNQIKFEASFVHSKYVRYPLATKQMMARYFKLNILRYFKDTELPYDLWQD